MMLRLSLVSLLVWSAVVSADHYHNDGEQQLQSVQHQLHFLAPHPLAGQVVASDDAMLAAMLGHYGKPPSGCLADEAAFEISGVPGMVCAPTCDSAGRCPSDLPDGVSARPQCALENRSTGDKYCVLICQTAKTSDATRIHLRGITPATDETALEDGMCGEATCQEVQPGLGICTYDV